MLQDIPRHLNWKARVTTSKGGNRYRPCVCLVRAQFSWTFNILLQTHPTLSLRYLWVNLAAAVVPSARSTSTIMPTFSPEIGSTRLTQGMESFAKNFILHCDNAYQKGKGRQGHTYASLVLWCPNACMQPSFETDPLQYFCKDANHDRILNYC